MSEESDKIDQLESTLTESLKAVGQMRQQLDDLQKRFEYSTIECSYAVRERDALKAELELIKSGGHIGFEARP